MTEQSQQIAELLFPNVTETLDLYETKYPARVLPEGAYVTRFAPSPTGFIHIGGVYTALLSQRLAAQTSGVFILRIEDTDKNREVENGISGIVEALRHFDIPLDEGVLRADEEIGAYAPYIQSKRLPIYHSAIKQLLANGSAYPCFLSSEDLDEIKKEQEAVGERIGCYGKWARYREATLTDIEQKVTEGIPFVIRLKSPGSFSTRIVLQDLVKGKIEMPENDLDMVLIKSDGYPTYHFAHVVDDHFMRMTHIIRGDEWLPSYPIHTQLFRLFRWKEPKYAHISPIMKQDGASKRKLSKRKDPEAAITYYDEQGYPKEAVIEYLINLANSNFEDWRTAHPDAPFTDFSIQLKKMNVSGALFDGEKLENIAKNIIAKMSASDVYEAAVAWAKIYDAPFAAILTEQKEYSLQILNIERTGKKPRKDIGKWSEVKDSLLYFFDDFFESKTALASFLSEKDIKNAAEILLAYKDRYDPTESKDAWFETVKKLARDFGFAESKKEYEANATKYVGHVGDVAMLLRIALTGRMNTPDLWEVMKVMGSARVFHRLRLAA